MLPLAPPCHPSCLWNMGIIRILSQACHEQDSLINLYLCCMLKQMQINVLLYQKVINYYRFMRPSQSKVITDMCLNSLGILQCHKSRGGGGGGDLNSTNSDGGKLISQYTNTITCFTSRNLTVMLHLVD